MGTLGLRLMLTGLITLLTVTIIHTAVTKADEPMSVGQLKAMLAHVIALDEEGFRTWCGTKQPAGSYHGAGDGSVSCGWYVNPGVSRDKSRTAGAGGNYLPGKRLPVRAMVFHPDVPYSRLVSHYKKRLGPPSCRATNTRNPCWITKMDERRCRVIVGRDARSTHLLVYFENSDKR